MKKTPILLAAGLLALAGCGPVKSSSSVTDGTEPPASTTPTTQSTPSTDTTPPATDWTAEEAEIIAALLGDHAPVCPGTMFPGVEYEALAGLSTAGDPVLIVQMYDLMVDDVEDIIAAHAEGGVYEDITDEYAGYIDESVHMLEAFYDDQTMIQAQIGTYSPVIEGMPVTTGYCNIEIDYFGLSVYYDECPTENLNYKVDALYGLAEGTASFPLITGTGYLLTSLYDQQYNKYPGLLVEGNDAAGVAEELVAAAWDDFYADYYGDDAIYLIDESGSIGVLLFDGDDGYAYIQVVLNSLLTGFPLEEIKDYFLDNDYLDPLTITDEIPAPAFACDGFETMDYYGSLYVLCYPTDGADHSQEYIDQLTEAGYFPVAYISGEYYYSSPNRQIMICVAYDELYQSVGLFFQIVSDNYVTEWPAELVNGAITKIGGAEVTATLPTPAFDWDFGVVYDNTDFSMPEYGIYPEFNIDIQDVGEDGGYVAHAEDYAAQLNAADSGWIYDDVIEVWHDATGKVEVEIYDDPENGFSIYIRNYEPVAAEFEADLVAEGLSLLGIEGTLPAFTGARGYQTTVGASALTIDLLKTDQAAVDGYVEGLVATGWTSVAAGNLIIYINPEKTMVMTIALSGDRAQMIIQDIGIWEAKVEDVSSWFMMMEMIMGIDLPFPASWGCPEGTIGVDNPPVSEDPDAPEYYFYYYIFDTSFVSGFEAELVELGYVKAATPDDGFTASYVYTFTETVSFTVEIYVGEGYAVIALV